MCTTAGATAPFIKPNTSGLGINKKDFTVNTANNRLGVPGGQSGTMTYDAAGDLTTDTYTGHRHGPRRIWRFSLAGSGFE